MDETNLRLMAHAAALMMCQFSKTDTNCRVSPNAIFMGIKTLTVSDISLEVVERMLSHKRIRSVITKRFPNHVTFSQVSSKSGDNKDLKSLYHVNFDDLCKTIVFSSQSIFEALVLESLFVFHGIVTTAPSLILESRESLMAPLSVYDSPEPEPHNVYKQLYLDSIEHNTSLKSIVDGQSSDLSDLKKRLHQSQKNSSKLKVHKRELKLKLLEKSAFGTGENPMLLTSSQLVELVKKRGAFKTLNDCNKQHQLSNSTGLFLYDMWAGCGVSVEKIPTVVSDVVNMLFGELTDDALQFLVPSDGAAGLAIERAAALVTEDTKQSFTNREGGERVLFASLMIDESNKKESPLKCKLFVFKSADGALSMKGLKTDYSLSKKTKNSADQVIESIIQELGLIGAALFISSTCDWFAGGLEAKHIMTCIDVRVAENCEQLRSILELRSNIVVDLIYSYLGPIRQQRVRPCEAHNVDRILDALLSIIAQMAGLMNDVSTSQGMYRINYYISKKMLVAMRALLIRCYGGRENVPRLLWNRFGNTASNRWLSRQVQAQKLRSIMNIAAPPSLVEYGKEYLTNWEAFTACATCFSDKTQISAFMILVAIISNITPGGVTSESRAGCLRILGFLGSSEHRIAIAILADCLPLHKRWLAFINGRSTVFKNAEVNSTRVLENSVFARNVIAEVVLLGSNWKAVLPNAWIDIVHISSLSVGVTQEACLARWEQTITEPTHKMLQLALKYFRDIDLGIGWSISLLTDPFLAPCVAKGILLGLGIESSDAGLLKF